MYTRFQEFLPAIKKLHPSQSLTKDDLLIDDFLMEKDGELRMYFAPHNEYINNRAIIVIVGITPGWFQMKTGFEYVLKALENSFTDEEILKGVKKAASFSGAIRSNLIQMLDECGVHEAIRIHRSSSLFEENRYLLHTTSTIKYPIFYQGKNYTGHQPRIEKSPLLSKYAFDVLSNELNQLQQSALIIPLGKTVERVFKTLQKEGELRQHFCLFGFPHPSGANGHRKKQFDEHKESFISVISEWACHQRL